MTGAWAREADACGAHLSPEAGLARAARHLAFMLETDDHWFRSKAAILASAIIRRGRRLDLKEHWPRQNDWAGNIPGEALIWYALRAVAQAANLSASNLSTSSGAWHLREAEAALRTLHKRGQS